MPGYMEMAGNESGRDWVGAIRDVEIKLVKTYVKIDEVK